jgi:hypothetical protein
MEGSDGVECLAAARARGLSEVRLGNIHLLDALR